MRSSRQSPRDCFFSALMGRWATVKVAPTRNPGHPTLYPWVLSRKNPITIPGIMLSEMPIGEEIILPLGPWACIMKMTDYMV